MITVSDLLNHTNIIVNPLRVTYQENVAKKQLYFMWKNFM